MHHSAQRPRWPLCIGISAALLNARALAEPAAPASPAPESPAPVATAPESAALDAQLDDLAGKSLEELLDVPVVTATKTKSKLGDAPAIISVITREDMARRGFESLAEVLEHTLGFYVVDDHTLPNAGVRGMAGGLFGESSGIKVMIDGHSVAFRSTGSNWLGPELIPLSAVERIEIIRGPSSALYGADAFLGVVNVITRRGEQLQGADVRASTSFSSGRDPARDLDMSGGGRKGPLEVLVATRLHEEDRSGLALPSSSPAPRIPDYRLSDPLSRAATHSTQVAFGRATYHYDANHSLTLAAHHSAFDRGAEFSPWTQMPYGLDAAGRLHQTRISLRQTSVGLIHQSSFSPTAGLTLQGYYFSGGPNANDRIDVGSQVYQVRREFGYRGLEALLEGRASLMDGLAVVGGTEVNVDSEQLPGSSEVLLMGTDTLRAGETAGSSSVQQQRKSISNAGVYGQASWTNLAPYLNATGGVRYDHHSIYGGQLSGRFGAVSNPVRPLHFKLLYGTAFKAPSPLLLYAVPYAVGDIIGNPGLKPQRVHTVEAEATVEPLKGFLVSTGLAYSRLLNQAEFVQQGVNRTARNLSEMSVLSWENAITAEHRWVHARASFELPFATRQLGQQGYFADLVGTRNVIYPSYLLRMSLSGNVPGVPLRAGAEAIQVGPRRASDMNILENGASYTLPSYLMLDATLSTVGLEFLEERETVLMLKVRNLLDSAGPDPGFAGIDYPLLPRSVMLQLRQAL